MTVALFCLLFILAVLASSGTRYRLGRWLWTGCVAVGVYGVLTSASSDPAKAFSIVAAVVPLALMWGSPVREAGR